MLVRKMTCFDSVRVPTATVGPPAPRVQPARLELPLLDPQLRRHLRLVAAHLPDEPLGVLAADERLELDPSGKPGERASSTIA
jgi:hypothetical protein